MPLDVHVSEEFPDGLTVTFDVSAPPGQLVVRADALRKGSQSPLPERDLERALRIIRREIERLKL
jgi:hypothetical protein